ncbi:hypothetical protein [Ancylomarina longa]|uniref:Uncharacterized protein n=1 Tax=Ancylomarina longa TaxID=2487017 RepID=A0A434AYD4_9BACT|nr:hypothetical protein [Ancylomarina longa]RUT79478.1 hypothetical protein DLK05_04455 [Ancylomarina longa]
MSSFNIYKAIYYLGVALIFIGGYRFLKGQDHASIFFSIGLFLYAGLQLYLLSYQPIKSWERSEYLKLVVGVLYLSAVVLLLFMNMHAWYAVFILGMTLDFFTNIFKKIRRQ